MAVAAVITKVAASAGWSSLQHLNEGLMKFANDKKIGFHLKPKSSAHTCCLDVIWMSLIKPITEHEYHFDSVRETLLESYSIKVTLSKIIQFDRSVGSIFQGS